MGKDFIEDETSKQVKQQLKELQQIVNPNPYTEEEREKEIKRRLALRDKMVITADASKVDVKAFKKAWEEVEQLINKIGVDNESAK